MVKEYLCFHIGTTAETTERLLDRYAKDRWKLICSYAFCGMYLIMERDRRKRKL